jgi:CRISPR-associated protein Cmr3
LEPLAPLIVRSGRPFDAVSGVDEARFPPPSTLAGCLRTAWARASGHDFGPALAELAVAGPLLIKPDAGGGNPRWLVPKPADAHYFHAVPHCVRAAPGAFPEGCGADLPGGLRPVVLTESVTGKPAPGPAWWDWEDLLAFRAGKLLMAANLDLRGWSPPAGDRRTHVALDPKTLAADPGRLFQTEGLDLEPTNRELGPTQPLRLLARLDQPLPAGLAHLGGERRLAQLQPEPETHWPGAPDGLWRRIAEAGGLTLTLLTPVAFAAGYRPGWLDEDGEGTPPGAPGARLRLAAVALGRWQAHSGWDLAAQAPRPTRKLVGAGTTYWFEFRGTPDPAALASLWLASLGDSEQDRRDGFGLAVPLPWSPTP